MLEAVRRTGRPHRHLRLSAVGAVAAALVAVTVNSGQAGAASNSSSPPGPPAAPANGAPAPAGVPGVTAGPNGWLNYTNTVSSKLHLAHAVTRTVAGKRSAEGSCQVSGSSVAKPGTAATFEEEVALNPATCAQKIVTGTLDQSGVDALNAVVASGAAVAPSAGAIPAGATRAPAAPPGAPTTGPPAPETQQASPITANASWGSAAYTKTAYIDPVDITITSLTANIQYPRGGSGPNVYYWGVPYSFSWDGWSSSGVSNTFSYLYPSDTYGWQVESVDHFTNSDFAAFIYVTFGLAGFLACGAQFTTTAHFNHDVVVQGFSNGNRGSGYHDSVNGACANLVHHMAWSGTGLSS